MSTEAVAEFIDAEYSNVGLQVQGRSKSRLRVLLPKTVENASEIILSLSRDFNAECTIEQCDEGLELHVFPQKQVLVTQFSRRLVIALLVCMCFLWYAMHIAMQQL